MMVMTSPKEPCAIFLYFKTTYVQITFNHFGKMVFWKIVCYESGRKVYTASNLAPLEYDEAVLAAKSYCSLKKVASVDSSPSSIL